MKKLLILTIFYLHFGQVFAQSVVWQREIDYAPISWVNGYDDQLLNIHLVDTNTFYSTVYTGRMRVPNFSNFYPLMLKHRASDGAIIDTIQFFDTTSIALSCYNPHKKQFWIIQRREGYNRIRSVAQKIDLEGRTLVYQPYRNRVSDSVTGYPNKIIPASDGGYYLLGAQDVTFNNQELRLWQVTRWDSTATRKWTGQYMFEYTEGVPQEAEFLPNGNLFVSGWHGPQIMALEIDTANGRMVDRKVLYTHPRNFSWAYAAVTRHPEGYFINATQSGGSDTASFNGFFNLNGQSVWLGFRRYIYGSPIVMSDSSIWVNKASITQQLGNRYERLTSSGEVLHSISVLGMGLTYVGVAGHYTNGDIILGGGVQSGSYSALFFTKIDSIGTPYNPIYPPVGPVLTSNQKQNLEPNLQVYPNPFTNTLRLSHKGNAQLLDVHGRVILSQPVEAGEELKVGSLPKGMYLLRLQSVGGKLYVRKVIKE